MEIEFIGTLLELDNYNKIVIKIIDPSVVLKHITNKKINYPIIYTTDGINCKISIYKHKNYYIDFVKNNINKQVLIKIIFKYYKFNEKEGISFLLKYIELL